MCGGVKDDIAIECSSKWMLEKEGRSYRRKRLQRTLFDRLLSHSPHNTLSRLPLYTKYQQKVVKRNSPSTKSLPLQWKYQIMVTKYLLLLPLLLCGSTTTQQRSSSKLPNIVFYLPDEVRAESLGTFGHPVTQTPSYDRLAALGTTFTNAHSLHTQCTPSRCAMLTGRYMHTMVRDLRSEATSIVVLSLLSFLARIS